MRTVGDVSPLKDDQNLGSQPITAKDFRPELPQLSQTELVAHQIEPHNKQMLQQMRYASPGIVGQMVANFLKSIRGQ